MGDYEFLDRAVVLSGRDEAVLQAKIDFCRGDHTNRKSWGAFVGRQKHSGGVNLNQSFILLVSRAGLEPATL